MTVWTVRGCQAGDIASSFLPNDLLNMGRNSGATSSMFGHHLASAFGHVFGRSFSVPFHLTFSSSSDALVTTPSDWLDSTCNNTTVPLELARLAHLLLRRLSKPPFEAALVDHRDHRFCGGLYPAACETFTSLCICVGFISAHDTKEK